MRSPAHRNDPFFTVEITHLPTGKKVSFEGWVTKFADQFSSNWSTESVYGRMDPLAKFQNTQRKISLGFDIAMDDIVLAASNFDQINQLITFLYPVYSDRGSNRNARSTLKSAPLIGLKWTNLVSNVKNSQYLVGYLDGLDYSPEVEQGGFILRQEAAAAFVRGNPVSTQIVAGAIADEQGRGEGLVSNSKPVPDAAISEAPVPDYGTNMATIAGQQTTYIPKKVNISFNFSVLHTHLTGWTKNEAGTYVFGGEGDDRRFPSNFLLNTWQITEPQTANSDVQETPNPVMAAAQLKLLGGDS
jgi:hypothetical protein